MVSTASWNWAGEPAERVEESRLASACEDAHKGRTERVEWVAGDGLSAGWTACSHGENLAEWQYGR